MDNLRFDFTADARRGYILQTCKKLLGDAAAQVEQAAAGAGVPDRHHHDLPEILSTISDLRGVSQRVRTDMRGIYQVLAEAEATVHGCAVEETHFHEVGNAEAIRCVLEICLCIEALDPQGISATPVQTGSGQVECAHGILDIPAPATAAIIARGIPTCSNLLEGELCTPTSAAIIYHFVDSFATGEGR